MADELDRLGVSPSKRRGQSFLRDENVARRQVMAAAVAPGDEVLEVGGGLGVLTQELARRGARLRVIEIEPAFVRHLRALKLDDVEVEQADALAVELGTPKRVVANIPYAISSELIGRLVGCGAEVIVQRAYSVEIVETVPPTAFFPQPKVGSAVIRLRRKKVDSPVSQAQFATLVGALFLERRKKIRNTVGRAATAVRASPERGVKAAEEMGISDRRPEELTVEQFEALARSLCA